MKETTARYWLSSERMTFSVVVDYNYIIIESAPIARKFKGQSLFNLVRWMMKQGGFRMERMDEV